MATPGQNLSHPHKNFAHSRIYQIRGRHVMLGSELAQLHGITARVFMQRVLRNKKRFPDDFIFQLSEGESREIRSRKLLIFRGRYSKHPPYAFTKPGVAMLSSLFQTDRAIKLNIAMARAHPGWLTSTSEDAKDLGKYL